MYNFLFHSKDKVNNENCTCMDHLNVVITSEPDESVSNKIYCVQIQRVGQHVDHPHFVAFIFSLHRDQGMSR